MSDKRSGDGPAQPGRQGDLFEDLEPAADARFATAERIELDQTSWIEYVPRWPQGSASLFDDPGGALAGHVPAAVSFRRDSPR